MDPPPTSKDHQISWKCETLLCWHWNFVLRMTEVYCVLTAAVSLELTRLWQWLCTWHKWSLLSSVSRDHLRRPLIIRSFLLQISGQMNNRKQLNSTNAWKKQHKILFIIFIYSNSYGCWVNGQIDTSKAWCSKAWTIKLCLKVVYPKICTKNKILILYNSEQWTGFKMSTIHL